MTNYEENVIKPILKTIEKYQEFLTKIENRPQLAKLGFMFNTFYYAGRISYGYDGLVQKDGQCENNPKYELSDEIQYINSDIEDIIYDAWGMHVSNDGNSIPFDEIKKMILEGKPLSEFEIKYRKVDKTFDEWVDVLTDKRFKYHRQFPDRRSVVDHLLCVIGNGYGYNKNTGFVFEESGGANQDKSEYGDWENSVFIPEILDVVKQILDVLEVKLAVDAEVEMVNKINAKKQEENKKRLEDYLETINLDRERDGLEPLVNISENEIREELDKVFAKRLGVRRTKQKIEYYPISNYSIIKMLDEKSHPSYIKAAVDVCKDIAAYPPEIGKDFNEYQINQRNEMIKFADDFLKKWENI